MNYGMYGFPPRLPQTFEWRMFRQGSCPALKADYDIRFFPAGLDDIKLEIFHWVPSANAYPYVRVYEEGVAAAIATGYRYANDGLNSGSNVITQSTEADADDTRFRFCANVVGNDAMGAMATMILLDRLNTKFNKGIYLDSVLQETSVNKSARMQGHCRLNNSTRAIVGFNFQSNTGTFSFDWVLSGRKRR